MDTSAQDATSPRRENPLLSILLNIVVPVIILTRFSSDEWLGPMYGLVVALAFPLAYGIFDYSRRRTLNFIPIVGVVGILLTGGIGLLKLDPMWIAVKEGAVPLVIGIVNTRLAQDPLFAAFRLVEPGNRQRRGERRAGCARYASGIRKALGKRHIHRGRVVLPFRLPQLHSGASRCGQCAGNGGLQ